MPIVYRVIRYDGPEWWLQMILKNSIQGSYDVGEGTITATVVNTIASWNEDALEKAGKKICLPQAKENNEFISIKA